MTQPIGYSGAPTNYSPYRVPQLWQMVEDEDGTLAGHQEQAWKRQEQLLNSQVARLRKLRDDLTAKWPPEKNQAAAVFIAHVDTMITAMESTSVAAGEIRSGLREIAASLREARLKLQPIAAKYSDSSEAWTAFNNRMLPGLPDWLVPDRPIPGLQTFEPLIVRAHQGFLDTSAREILQDTDSKTLESRAKLVELPRFDRFQSTEAWNPAGNRVLGGFDSDARTDAPFEHANLRAIPTPIFDPPPPITHGVAQIVDAGDPLLTGTVGHSSTVELHEQRSAKSGQLTYPTGTLPVGGVIPGIGRSLPPKPGTLGSSTTGPLVRSSPVQSSTKSIAIVPALGTATVKAGPFEAHRISGTAPGIINGAHGASVGSRTSEADGATRSRGRLSAGRPTISVTGMDNMHGPSTIDRYRDRSYEEYAEGNLPAQEGDSQWATEQGVTPIIRPSRNKVRHDPGPGVIGIDL